MVEKRKGNKANEFLNKGSKEKPPEKLEQANTNELTIRSKSMNKNQM